MAFALICKSKSPSEAERCLEHVLPVAVLQGATAANRNVRQAAKNFVRRAMESREVGASAMEAYGRAAVGSEDSRTCVAACKAVPDVFDSRVPSADVGHVVEALYGKMSSEAEGARAAEERQEALEALVRGKQEMGEQEFNRRSMKAKFAEREKFKELEFKQQEAHASMWFGVVTGETMDMVKNEADKAERAEGAFRLKRELEGRRGNLSPLVPHMTALLEFLGTDLMTDANPKVVLHAIEAHETVIVQGGELNHGTCM